MTVMTQATPSGTRRGRAVALASLTVAVLAVGLAGCGAADAADDGVATAGGAQSPSAEAGGNAGAAAGGEQLSDEERRLKFAECMREQGIDMPDPGSGGGVRFRAGPGMDQEQIQKAMEACQEYAPNGGNLRKPDPEQLERMREFAKCMRANGVPEFPDPDPNGGGLRITPDMGVRMDDPAFQAATEKCRQFAPRMRGQQPGQAG